MSKARPRSVTPLASMVSPEILRVLERIRKRLLEVSPDRLFEAALAAQIGVAESFDKNGVRTDVLGVADKWPDGAAIVNALRTVAPEILEVSPWILEVIDREKAVEAAVAICTSPVMGSVKPPAAERDYFAGLLRERASEVVHRNLALVPIDAVLAVAAQGELAVGIGKDPVDDHPALQHGASIVAALQKTRWFDWRGTGDDWPRDQGLARHLLERLSALGYTAAVPVLETLFNTTVHRIRWEVADTLEKLGSKLPREALIKGAEDGTLATDPLWEPLRERAVWAVFEADPRTAYDRFARYLRTPKLTDEGPRTVMDTIAAVLSHDHQGVRGPTGFGLEKRGFYKADPRWAALIERMADDPFWEKLGWTFEKLSEQERSRRFAAWKRRQSRAAKPSPKPTGKKAPTSAKATKKTRTKSR